MRFRRMRFSRFHRLVMLAFEERRLSFWREPSEFTSFLATSDFCDMYQNPRSLFLGSYFLLSEVVDRGMVRALA